MESREVHGLVQGIGIGASAELFYRTSARSTPNLHHYWPASNADKCGAAILMQTLSSSRTPEDTHPRQHCQSQ